MVAIWWGTQADEAFPDAWHSDAGGQAQFRSKVYLSPKLWYLRVNVIEAQDLLSSDRVMAEPVSRFAVTTYTSYRLKWCSEIVSVNSILCSVTERYCFWNFQENNLC